MKVLKGLALSILGILLGLSLSIFGLAFMLNSTILNPNFITSELDRIDVSAVVEEFLGEQGSGEGGAEEFGTAMVDTIAELEPVLKEQVGAAIHPVYDYLLGRSESLDLALMLRNEALTSDFVAAIMDKLDISSLLVGFLKEQLTGQIPEEVEPLIERLDDIIDKIEPTLKAEIVAAADPIADYLLGESQKLDVEISLAPVVEGLREPAREVFLEQLPPEVANLSQSELDQAFDEFFEEFTEMIPATFELDKNLIGTEIPAQIAESLAKAEEMLGQGRQYVGYFQLGYKILIAVIVLLIAGIVLIHRRVKGATRGLGIISLSCGIPWLVGIFVAKYFVGRQIAQLDVPPFLEELLPQLINDFLPPLQMFVIGLSVIGVILLVASFVYPRWRQSEPEG